jgi:lysozyme
VDTQWENNRETLLEIEKPHGAYHFFSVTSDPEQQARHFLNYWKKEDMDLPPVLDVETSAETDAILINSMKKWLKIVENESGMRPIIYTSLSFYETKFQNDFKDYYFWIAAYSRRPECLKDERILHWQYSDNGDLPGINKKIDLNVSKISFD